jgi:5'-nucleotidase
MLKFVAAASLLAVLSGCAGPLAQETTAAPVQVKIIAFNDFHGNLEPPKRTVEAPRPEQEPVRVPAGGAAYLAGAIDSLRADNPNHAVVSAGDMIGASPLTSSLFLDEPTILAMNLIQLDFNAVGNHEFDRGRAELLRMQNGGCEKHTLFEPCRIERSFPGARFGFLAANTITEAGRPLFAPYRIKTFGKGASAVKVGFVGLTLKRTATLVTPSGIAGITFSDEADTVNALIPQLKAEGADAIVVLIHQGGETSGGYNDKNCPDLKGEIVPVLDRLDPAVDVVVSGHTHRAYVCEYGRINPSRPFLLTSAGTQGMLLTDIELSIDPVAGKVLVKRADNIIVQSEGFTSPIRDAIVTDLFRRFSPDQEIAALVARYAAAARPLVERVIGRMSAPALREMTASNEHVLGNLIADAQLAATREPGVGGAQIAFMNPGGVRADLVPAKDGTVTYGQLYAIHPFGNTLVVKSFTGRQVRAILEQQFNSGGNTVERPNVLLVSRGFRYGFDLSRPAGQRIIDPMLDGEPLRDDTRYRVTITNFLASGGDHFSAFAEGTDPVGGMQDVDALVAYIAGANAITPPAADRISNLTPRP